MVNEMFKPLRNLLIAIIIILLILLFNFNNKYYSNTFKVTINNNEVYVQYYEKYKRGIIPFIVGTVNSQHSSNEVTPIVNDITYNKTMILNIKEYEAYWKKYKDRSYENKRWVFQDKYNYKETTSSSIHLVIKRKNKILYDGKYIEDISKYVNEKGRYFFNAEVTRKDNFYSTLKTYMSFNVIVGGDQYEE